jgi:competence protein ComEC
MTNIRKQNKATLVISLLVLIFLALYNLLESQYLLPEDAAMGYQQTQPDTVEVHFIDVGHGDSIYIKTPTQDILIDGGERGSNVVEYLNQQEVKSLELVIGTYPNSNHIGGLISVFEEIPVKEVMDPGVVHTSNVFENYIRLIEEENIIHTVARAGLKRTFEDGTTIEVFSPHRQGQDTENLHNFSVVVRFTFKNVSFLFTGDIESSVEKELLEKNYPLNSTILKAGHHGSSDSNSDEFLQAVNPEVVVIMCGSGNPYGLPHQEVLDKLEEAEVDVYRTDLSGSIVVETNGYDYDVRVEHPDRNNSFLGI